MQIILGIGSNLGDRLSYLNQAVEALDFLNIRNISSIYENDAVLPEHAPEEWNLPFLNMAVFGDTKEDLHTVLNKIKEIEQKLGRDLFAPRWSPREIDIDILLADISSTNETCWVPHKELLNRTFALVPAREIAGNMIHPGVGKALKDIFIDTSNLRLTNNKINPQSYHRDA